MTNKIALVTGAARGIGFACAEALAADDAQVIIVDLKESAARDAAARIGRGAVGYANQDT